MTAAEDVSPAFWRAMEALHSVVYFADGTRTHYPAVGLRGFWRGYFASRAAALGTPSAELVTATFFGFSPAFVARAVPEVWELADHRAVLEARREVATRALHEALEEEVPEDLVAGMVDLASHADLAGKPLAAAHAALAPPTDPLGRLWHAATVLRELHGDCHVAVLVAEGLDGCSANVLAQAVGLVPDTQREHRGWTEDEWSSALRRLKDRGWVAADGTATPAGTKAREDIEDRTHAASTASLPPHHQHVAIALTDRLVALGRRLGSSGPLAYPNPTGVPRP